ncbi:MAG TPA: hypothetical protein P5081_21030 [Phycisphaerae bacterium]|nr:hypothetical protein [Phycisphaerae bacterium]HRW55366.1 hypothetical protein [Phycisphaerae bacterium]
MMYRPSSWPAGVRVMLTAFLVMIGGGYLFAIANIYHQHQMADGEAGLTLNDLRAAYAGLTIRRTSETTIPSRMLTMLRTSMREYVDDDAEFSTLEGWLKDGGTQAGLTQGEKRDTPERAMILNCMRCHATSSGTEISKKAPFGPDEFTVDYEEIKPLVASETSVDSDIVNVPPQLTIPRLVLVTHAHMLAIPVFTLIVGGLFAGARFPRGLGSWITPLPMLALVMDFSGWWLARGAPAAIYLIAAAGAIFGVAFGLQLIVVLVDLWRPMSRSATANSVS